MDMMKTVKCLLALIKCSKALYFIKKLVCFAAVGILVTGILLQPNNVKKCKKLMRKVKAVM